MTGLPLRRHPLAVGFDRVAGAYERGRPGYPPQVVRFVRRQLGRHGRSLWVELGSGTGKLTRSMLGPGTAVVAVEPSAGMRAEFDRAVPLGLAIAGAAEAIPLPDGCADGVYAAQAFHWFRPGPTSRSIARVLRPGGTVVVLWNFRDERDPLVRKLDALVDRYGGRRPARWRSWRQAFHPAAHRFGPLHHRRFRYVRDAPVEEIVQHVLSVSRVARLPPGRRRALVAEVRRLLRVSARRSTLPRVALPSVTDVYWTRRLAGGAGRRRARRRTVRTRRRPSTSRH